MPEIASRYHIESMTMVFEEAFKKANLTPKDIDLVAVTEGPGLIGSLLVGINAASTFAFAWYPLGSIWWGTYIQKLVCSFP